ncbi:MAG: hypothetical protein ACHQ49_04440 [Elusimicrobiota bacterium]
MNAKALKDFLAAASACDPEASFSGPDELCAAVAEAAPGREWEIGVGAGAPPNLRLALRSPDGFDAALAAAAARALGVDAADIAGEPPAARPWLEAVWNSKSALWHSVDIGGRERRGDTVRRLRPKRESARTISDKDFKASFFAEPVASALAEFAALAPVERIQFAAGRPGWTLVLAAPLAWPLFLRCDVAAAFAPRAAELSLLLRDARVAALEFDGDALWARLTG